MDKNFSFEDLLEVMKKCRLKTLWHLNAGVVEEQESGDTRNEVLDPSEI